MIALSGTESAFERCTTSQEAYPIYLVIGSGVDQAINGSKKQADREVEGSSGGDDAGGVPSEYRLPASSLRVLMALEESMKPQEIAGSSGLPSSTVYRALRRLEDEGLIEETDAGVPVRSFKGSFLVQKLRSLDAGVSLIEENEDFFEQLEVELPDGFVSRLDELSGGRVLRPEGHDPFAAVYRVKGLMESSDSCRCVSPVFVEPYIDMALGCLESGRAMDLVTTGEVVSLIEERFGDRVQGLEGSSGLDVELKDDLPGIMLLVNGSGVAVSFRGDDGGFPLNRVLMAEGESAVRFGRDLFRHLKG